MGKYFSDAVEEALRYIYYDVRAGKGAEGFELLKKASEEGDGDASCILARCLSGSQYVWGGHNFPEDDDQAIAYIHKAVEQGSAIGVLVSLRCGEFSQEMEEKMPFSSLEEAFNIVLEKAEAGDAFCQYTVGNTYFWWDFIDIQKRTPDTFSSRSEFEKYVGENILKCEEWFHKALRGGIHFAANNLNRLYTKGDDDYVKPRPHLARDLYKIGAELGHPDLQWTYADELQEKGKKKEALEWYKKAAEGGQFECWYTVGEAYADGVLVKQDMAYAVKCFENGLKQNKISWGKRACASRLGWMYCEGIEVAKDGEKAFPLLKLAVENGNDYRIGCLGKCYFRGWGTMPDYVKARELLEKAKYVDHEVDYMLGVIYAQGLGVSENIGKGVKYLKQAGNYPEAKAELAKYKKPLFGKWVRKEN